MNPNMLVLLATAAFLLPTAVAFAAGRRFGIQILWAALIAGALLGIFGWIVTRDPLFGEAAMRRSITIYFVLLPGFVGLVLGAIGGAMNGRFGQTDSR